jgi:hypothetical protein
MEGTMRRITASLLLLSLVVGTAAHALTREEIAIENYRLLMNGQIRITDLSQQQQVDVAEVDRKLREEAERRNSPQGCYEDEVKKLAQPPTYLGRRSAALKCGIPFEEAEAGQGQ